VHSILVRVDLWYVPTFTPRGWSGDGLALPPPGTTTAKLATGRTLPVIDRRDVVVERRFAHPKPVGTIRHFILYYAAFLLTVGRHLQPVAFRDLFGFGDTTKLLRPLCFNLFAQRDSVYSRTFTYQGMAG